MDEIVVAKTNDGDVLVQQGATRVQIDTVTDRYVIANQPIPFGYIAYANGGRRLLNNLDNALKTGIWVQTNSITRIETVHGHLQDE